MLRISSRWISEAMFSPFGPLLNVYPLEAADSAETFECAVLVFKPDQRFESASAKCVGQNPSPIGEDKERIVQRRDGNMPKFHPSFGFPSHEFRFIGGQIFRAHHRCCAVVLLQSVVHDQIAVAEIFRHRSSRVWSG